jgi:hypothetical protein
MFVNFFSACCRYCGAVDLKFDDPAAGFFLRSVDATSSGLNAVGGSGGATNNQLPAADATGGSSAAASPSAEPAQDGIENGGGGGRSARQFALLKSSGTVVLRAAYGPFLTSQTVTPASRIPLAAAAEYANISNAYSSDMAAAAFGAPSSLDNGAGMAAATAGPALSPYADLSAHLVTREVRKDQPVLRVVFHAGQSLRHHGPAARKKANSGGGGGGGMCIVLSGQLSSNKTVESTCTPQGIRFCPKNVVNNFNE